MKKPNATRQTDLQYVLDGITDIFLRVGMHLGAARTGMSANGTMLLARVRMVDAIREGQTEVESVIIAEAVGTGEQSWVARYLIDGALATESDTLRPDSACQGNA